MIRSRPRNLGFSRAGRRREEEGGIWLRRNPLGPALGWTSARRTGDMNRRVSPNYSIRSLAHLGAPPLLQAAPHPPSSRNQADAASGALGCRPASRSEEHTSELQSLMRNSYAVFCLKKKNK